MATFNKFKDILARQNRGRLPNLFIRKRRKANFSKDFDLKSQIRRASVSITANIAEGFGRRSDKEFANFLNIAHGSAYEVQSHLYLAPDLNYIDKETFNNLYESLSEICRMTYALGNKVRN